MKSARIHSVYTNLNKGIARIYTSAGKVEVLVDDAGVVSIGMRPHKTKIVEFEGEGTDKGRTLWWIMRQITTVERALRSRFA